jgi:hypothetical protein
MTQKREAKMSNHQNVREVINGFLRLVDAALEKGQNIHCIIHQGSCVDDPIGDAKGDKWRVMHPIDSATLTVIIDPSSPSAKQSEVVSQSFGHKVELPYSPLSH